MQVLRCVKVTGRIIFILVLCSVQTEQRVTPRVDNTGTVEETVTIEDESPGFGFVKTVAFFRKSLPVRVYECLRDNSILRCMKIFMLQKMESHKQNQRTGNLTRDFLNQFITKEGDLGSLVLEHYRKMSDEELNKRLVLKLQRFFKDSDIKLRVLPGLLIKIIPSKDNKLKFSLKKKLKHDEIFTGRSQKTNDEVEQTVDIEAPPNSVDISLGDIKAPGLGKKRKNKKDGFSYKNTIMKMAVPVMVMPAILLGSILPFLLPVLKMATIMSMVLNNSAFIAALIYAARTQANAQDEQHISYGSHPIYH